MFVITLFWPDFEVWSKCIWDKLQFEDKKVFIGAASMDFFICTKIMQKILEDPSPRLQRMLPWSLSHLSLLLLFTEQTSDGVRTGGHHAVRGLPGLHARHQRERAALRGRGQPGREIHEEEDLQVGLMETEKTQRVCAVSAHFKKKTNKTIK